MYSGGAQCWPTMVQAAQAQCQSVAGSTAGGVVSCDGVVSVGESSAVLRFRFVGSSGVTLQDQAFESADCDYPTFTGYWGPVLAAALVAVVTVKAFGSLRGMFKRESL